MSSVARPIRAVLFDLDGTLIDNMRFHIDAWIETGRLLGRELTAEQIMRDFSGRRNDEILPGVATRVLAPEEIARLSEEKEARYRALYAPHLGLLAGADAFLQELAARGIQRAIATAAPPSNRNFVVDGLALHARMNAVVGADEVARGKPAPDLFLEAARRLGVEPEHTLVFEDAVLGVQAGIAAGMRVCGVTTGEPAQVLRDAGASFTVPDFRELPEGLRVLLG